MGIEAFAQRAARELLATCETARKRIVEARGQLTAQEAQIARVTHDGFSNPEIAARLFIRPRTLEDHLRARSSSGSTSARAKSCPTHHSRS